MWSFYFMMLDFFNEKLLWRTCKNVKSEETRDIKAKCLAEPEKYLWKATEDVEEMKSIFNAIKSLQYSDRPNYNYIREQLQLLLKKEEEKAELKAKTHKVKVKTHKVNTVIYWLFHANVGAEKEVADCSGR